MRFTIYALRLAILTLAMALVPGCGTIDYSKSPWYFPNGANYTLSRDRMTGDLTDYMGLTWQFK